MNLYLVEQFYPPAILYISCVIYVLYLAPFIFTFTLVGIVNCIRDFPCKPICYNYYEEPEEEHEEVRRSLLRKCNSIKLIIYRAF